MLTDLAPQAVHLKYHKHFGKKFRAENYRQWLCCIGVKRKSPSDGRESLGPVASQNRDLAESAPQAAGSHEGLVPTDASRAAPQQSASASMLATIQLLTAPAAPAASLTGLAVIGPAALVAVAASQHEILQQQPRPMHGAVAVALAGSDGVVAGGQSSATPCFPKHEQSW